MYTDSGDNDVDAMSAGHDEDCDEKLPRVHAISLLELVQKEGDIAEKNEDVESTPSPSADIEDDVKLVGEMDEEELEKEFIFRSSKFGTEHPMTSEVTNRLV